MDHEFIGREALQEEVRNPRRVLRTLVWDSQDVLGLWGELFAKGAELPDFMDMPRERRGYMYADQVLCDGSPAGVSTSRGYSAYFREMLSLAVVDVQHSAIGTDVVVIWGNPGTPTGDPCHGGRSALQGEPWPHRPDPATDRAHLTATTARRRPPRRAGRPGGAGALHWPEDLVFCGALGERLDEAAQLRSSSGQ